SQWRGVLAGHGLSLPIWNTEERSAIPWNNLRQGLVRSFKFLHVGFSDTYASYGPLVDRDWIPLPAGIYTSVAAHALRNGTFLSEDDHVIGWRATYWRRGHEKVGAFLNTGGALGKTVTVSIAPVDAAVPPTATDAWGRSTTLAVTGGRARLALTSNVM